MRTKKIKQQYLFWCTTSGHEEDWFIQAENKDEAKESHENFEGLDNSGAKARLICKIPIEYCKAESCWPRHETLEALGFEFILKDSPRIVRRNGKLYKEGVYFEASFYKWDQFKQPLVYLINLRGTFKFKIGYTQNLDKRISQIQAHNPFHVDLAGLIVFKYAKRLEGELQTKYSKYKTNNEWFEFDEETAVSIIKEFVTLAKQLE